LNNYRVRARIRLGERHQPTGRTRHIAYGAEVRNVASLLIAKYDGDDGWYLLYLDAAGNELTDTYHDSVQDAKKQSEFEFDVQDSEWEMMDGWPQ
jgi:hypothetical protein